MQNYYVVKSYITDGSDIDPRNTQVYEAEIYEASNHKEAVFLHDHKTWDADHVEVIASIKGRYIGDDERFEGASRVFWFEPCTDDSELYLAHVATRIIL